MDRRSSTKSAADARLAWAIGGSLFAGSAILGLVLQPAVVLVAGGNVIGPVLFSAGLLVFAIGFRSSGSVTARLPLGTTAIVVLASWTLLVGVLGDVFFSTYAPLDTFLAFGYVDSLVRFAAALIAVAQIAQAGSVRRPWNRAPGCVLGAATAVWLMEQAVGATGGESVGSIAPLLWTLEGIVNIGGVMFLGVTAIVLANRPNREQTVSIYPRP